MRQKLFFILLAISCFYSSATTLAESDSILSKVMHAADKYSQLVDNYQADIYLRTSILTLKKNFLYKHTHYVPDFVLCDPKNDTGMIETYSSLKYKYPANYEHDIKKINGTLTSKEHILMLPYNLLNINVYDINTADERFILPVRFKSLDYYRYKLVQVTKDGDKNYYTFKFTPAYSSSKLLQGTFTVEENTWRVTYFSGVGNELFVDFKVDIVMGNQSWESFLPTSFKIYRTHIYLGNRVQNLYQASLHYNNIELRIDNPKKQSYNIGETHKVRIDSFPLCRDTVYWSYERDIPFDNNEQAIYRTLTQKQSILQADSLINKDRAVQLIAQSFIADTRYHYKKTDINYSGFLNPSMLSYSTHDGLNYRIRLSFKTHLMDDKSFLASAYAGYAFKYKDLVTNFTTVLRYHPRRLGELSLSVGKGNKAFSTLYINEIQDSLTSRGLAFSDIFVNYYKDYYAKVFNNIELFNGFQLGTGAEYHIRQATEKANTLLSSNENSVLEKRHYLVPTIRVSWTPKQFYRKEGFEKIYVRSNYPTFKIEYAKSIKDLLGSTSAYDRFEFDINQNVRIGLLQSIQYRVGTGFYTRQENDFFADFTYFARYNLPETWGDGIGGVFNVLPYSVYNASTLYAQAHFMYETPFLFFTLLPKLARGVLSERVYVSQLYTPYIQSYTEIGYGIGNRFVNAAVFGSFHKYTFQQIGGKVVFLLGK